MANFTKIPYEKAPKTFIEQVLLLKKRNLTIENEERAVRILTYISYNRLSNYWFPLLKEPKHREIFKEGAKFNTAFRLYQFDSEFRTVTFQAIEQIEIAIRSQIIYHFSHKYKSGFWFENKDAFKSYPFYLKLLNKLSTTTEESKQEFIEKYKNKYLQHIPPSWKSIELLTFNYLLSILKNISDYKDLIPISQSLGLNHKLLISWIESFVYVRNICAHHGRLWNIKLTISPTWIKSPRQPWVDRWENEEKNKATADKELKMYAIVCCLVYCLKSINPYNSYGTHIIKLLDKYHEVDTKHMGFPENWKNQPLWKNVIH